MSLMRSLPAIGFFKLGSLIKRSHARCDLLVIAFAALYAPLFFSNVDAYYPRAFFLIFLPAAFLMWVSFDSKFIWPTARFSFAFSPVFAFSIILCAVFVYLLSMNLSSWSQPGFDRRLMDKQWAYAGEILLFMGIAGLAVPLVRGFLTRLICVLVPLISISAAINLWQYLTTLPVGSTPLDVRLVNWLGMPGYTNSTNISLTYAVYFIAAFATIIGPNSGRWQRLLLTPFAAILLIAMLQTQARSAYTGIAVSVAVVVAITLGQAHWRMHWLKYTAVIAVLGIAFLLVPRTRDILTARESFRPIIWKTYAAKAIAKPLLGYGGLSNIDVTIQDGQVIDQPHNMVLSAQIRGGVFCLLAMICALSTSILWAYRFFRIRGDAVPLAMIVCVATTGMFDYNLLITAVTWPWATFWFPFAVCAGAEIATRIDLRQTSTAAI